MLHTIYSIEYFIGSMNGNYSDAINICYNDGGILAIITNEYQFNISRQICMNSGNNCWIGLNKLNIHNKWRYIDGTNVRNIYGFGNNRSPINSNGPWGNNEPNNLDGNEHCIHFNNLTEYMWNDISCAKIYSPLCMKIDTKPLKQLSSQIYMMFIVVCYADVLKTDILWEQR